ncbi:uncharacterized protein JCM6883_002833 [Sporobolomyces salmoneus]|uniref:uncharacterized protein n=1 Tax=Sporobolomyces salmoneus TaxID=183962 RepID=UPI003177AD36
MTSHRQQSHPYSIPAREDHPPFRPLPFDHSNPRTPPQAHSYTSDPFNTPYSSNDHDQQFPGQRSKETTFDPSIRDSYPPQGPPPPLARPRSRWSSFWATYKTKNQLSFLTIFGVQAVAVLVMILLIYITNIGDLRTSEILAQDPQLESVATYVSLFILAVVFELLVILDAFQQKNIIGILCLDAFQLALLTYSAVLNKQLANALDGSNADTPRVRLLVNAYSIVIPCVIGASSLSFFYLTWRLYEEFGWDVFKRIGADIRIRKCYQVYEIFVALLKFDGFFFLGFEIQFLVLVTGTKTVEFVLTIIALPVILLALGLTAVVVRIESRIGVYGSLLVQAAGMAYFAYKLARIYSEEAGPRYATAKATLTIFSVVALLMLLATFVLTGLCMSNFGKGLKEKIPGYAFNGGRTFLPGPSSQSNARIDKPSILAPPTREDYANGDMQSLRRPSGINYECANNKDK